MTSNLIDRHHAPQDFSRQTFHVRPPSIRKYASIALVSQNVPRAVSPAWSKVKKFTSETTLSRSQPNKTSDHSGAARLLCASTTARCIRRQGQNYAPQINSPM